MNNKQISIRDQYRFKTLSSNPFEILPSFCAKDFSPQVPDFLAMEDGSTTNPFGQFESGTECCISFPQFEHHDDCLPSKIDGSVISEHRPSISVDSAEEVYLNFQSTDTLRSLVQSYSGRDQLQVEDKLINESAANNAIDWNHSCTTISFEKIHKVESQGDIHYHGFTSLVSGNARTSERAAMTNKKRIRWTTELHNQFIECVHRLGGAKKATPKGILKLMNCEGLTIFHIKSHLQKHRVAQYIPNSKEGLEEIPDTGSVPKLDPKLTMQIVEALRMQIDVQRRLYEQLECQRKLQLKIEEQANQLKKLFDRQVEKLPI